MGDVRVLTGMGVRSRKRRKKEDEARE